MSTRAKILLHLLFCIAFYALGSVVASRCSRDDVDPETTELSKDLNAKTDELATQHIEDHATAAKAKRTKVEAKVQSEIQHEVSTSNLVDYLNTATGNGSSK